MSDVVIRTENLTKFYGSHRGIIEVNLAVNRGEIFGYLGPNGAGKTTTLRILMGYMQPNSGTASVLNSDPQANGHDVLKHVGYLPGELSLYEELTIQEFCQYFSHLRGGVSWSCVEELAERLQCDLRQRIKTLSQGNKQKVGLMQALMHQPDLLILDEPTNGLDPLIRHEFFKIITEFRKEGKTVLLSSHVLSEVERVCDRACIIRNGKIIAVEKISQMQLQSIHDVEIHFLESFQVQKFEKLPNVRSVSVVNQVLKCRIMGDMDQLIKLAAQYRIRSLNCHQPSLEEIFLDYYGELDHV
jgi:ABC-2 type transport system ATP-binding protein